MASSRSDSDRSDDQPNILFVLTDQQRPDWVGNHTEIPVRTPNLDALGHRGVYFNNAVCPAPLCAPSRTCLASGMEYDNCGITGNQDYPFEQPTLYQHLREAGYETIGVGDIDLHMDSPTWGLNGTYALDSMGFSGGIEIPGKRAMVGTYKDHLEETNHVQYDGNPPVVDPNECEPANAYMNSLRERDLLEAYVEDMTDRLYSDRPVSNFATTRPAPIPDDAYVDNWVGRHGLERLEAAPEDRPWFLIVNFVGPHEPMDVTQSMHELYRDPDVHFPAPVDPAGNLDADTHQEIRRNYAAMCETIDEWLGRYQETLRERGEWEDTVVIFGSDHGELLGDHGGWTKKSPRRASSGVPLAVAGPEVESLGAVDDPVTLLDIHATVCDYTNVEFENVDSRSLRPFLEGTGDPPRHAVRSGLHATDERPWWRMVFDGRFELIVGENLEAVEGMTGYTSPVLFDLETDPNETKDIAPQEPEIINRLGSHLPDGIHPE